jgi:hypothetical protein
VQPNHGSLWSYHVVESARIQDIMTLKQLWAMVEQKARLIKITCSPLATPQNTAYSRLSLVTAIIYLKVACE